MRDFLLGVSYLPRGFRLLWAPGLRRYVALPILINILVFGLLFWGGLQLYGDLLAYLLPNPERWSGNGWLDRTLLFLTTVLYWLLWPLFLIAAAVLMFYSFTLVANLIGSPFNGMLSAKVELISRGALPPEQDQSLAKELVVSVAGELRKLGYFAKLAIPLLVLFFIPVVNLLASALWAVFGAWALAVEYMDYPMGNRGMRFQQEREALRRRRLLALGFGFAVLAMTLVPVLNLLAMPTGVIAATLLWLDEFSESAET